MKLAAIDIGSNSIKMVVVDAAASDSFAVLAREKEVVRLGHATLREGHLSPEAIQSAAACLKRFRAVAEARGAERIVAIATASVREANNAAEFIDEVEGLTGVRVEVLSGVEEARLIGLAASQGCAARGVSLINVDIGGGSTEISLVRDRVPAELYSVKLGAVGLTESLIANDPPKQKELRALREEIRAALERPARELSGMRWQLATGTSGTIIAIGEALRLRALRKAGKEDIGAQTAGAEIPLERLARFNSRAAGMSASERRDIPGISAQRAEILVAGGQILEGAMQAFGISVLRSCDYALREGVIIDRLREWEAESRPPVPDVADQKLRGVHAVGRRFGYEEAHAHQVARLAEKIFDALAPLHRLSRHQRTLLSAAALLHDAGYHIAHEAHHKHSLYLIKNSEVTGFSEAERHVIANVARYHRGALPKERHADYGELNALDRETVSRLAAILRLADALDRSHDSRVQDLTCAHEGQRVQLRLHSAQPCDNEILAAMQRGDLFEQVFDCRLDISLRDAQPEAT
ncbi:MAG: exopolyphosphatase / guanosine-5'-triphosphate,3'-diphosphate pyrophosphatase [Blastocatellia bacterium]|nr:exopolyphosphatase / guanosine-5'-triphosphate,3'-diphosphate pyrophosphatase [Blastocatellia bacterium]